MERCTGIMYSTFLSRLARHSFYAVRRSYFTFRRVEYVMHVYALRRELYVVADKFPLLRSSGRTSRDGQTAAKSLLLEFIVTRSADKSQLPIITSRVVPYDAFVRRRFIQ